MKLRHHIVHHAQKIHHHFRTIRRARKIHHHFRIALFVIPLVLFLGYFALVYIAPHQPTKPLNVILISIDSLRTDHMGIYGYGRDTTPNIDKWAKDAVIFKNYFSTSFLTPISEVSVHTGKYPFSTGVVNFESTLPTSTPTLGEILKDHGWQTASFGNSPEFSGYIAGINLERGFDLYKYSQAGGDAFNGRGWNFVPQSIDWIEHAKKNNEPFFLWLAFGSVHWPYGQTEGHHFSSSTYEGYFGNVSFNTWNLVSYVFGNAIYGRYNKGDPLSPIVKLSPSDFDYLVGRYDDGIAMTDRRLGQLLRYLKDSGLDENTVVILQSEHGEGLNERGYVMHYDIYDEQTHMPLIIKAPMLKPEQIDAIASGVDVLPTLLSILKIPAPKTDGVDYLPYILHGGDAPRSEIYITRTALWERVMSSMHYEGLNGFYDLDSKEHFADTAIRNADWKLIHRRSRDAMARWSWFNFLSGKHDKAPEYELYYLKNDPGEQHNIYDEEQTNPSVIYLVEHLADWESKQFKTPLPQTSIQEIQPYF